VLGECPADAFEILGVVAAVAVGLVFRFGDDGGSGAFVRSQ